MKKKFFYVAASIGLFNLQTAMGDTQPDSLGLPGDNFNLYGAMDLFKQSENAEDFEKAINSADNSINNLDLNNDGEVDYIKVIDHSVGDDKVLILQAVISENESQDVAAIEMEKKSNDNVSLQIVGDEALYGKNYIVEPKPENDVAPGRAAPSRVVTHVHVNVWGWGGPRWMYRPAYVVWASPYKWRYYPIWWKPWRPSPWAVYHPRVIRYHHPYYHRVYVYNAPRAHKVYYGHRTTSSTVRDRYKVPVDRRERINRESRPADVRQKPAVKRDATNMQHERKAVKKTRKTNRKSVNGPRK